MTRRSARALLAASWTLAGCNVLVGLDDVNIVQDGQGGAPATNGGNGADGAGAPQDDAGATTGSGGDTPGTAAQGGATTGPQGGTGGDSASSSTGGDSTSSSTGGDSTSSSTGGDSTSSSTGGDSTSSSTGGDSTSSSTGGDSTSSSSSGGGGSTSSGGGAGGMGPGSPCGDGVIGDGEQCDDGNSTPGDGCSDACQVEPFFQCTTSGTSTCTAQEVLCTDGSDNDGDGLVDALDTDCALPAYAPPIACNTMRIYRSVDVPIPIPDKGGGTIQSAIVVPEAFGVAHVAVLLDVTHSHVIDIAATLIPPFGQPRVLTSDNGGGGSDYAQTLFDSACLQSVTSGMAPFQGCYKPESMLPSGGQQAQGVWKLSVQDHVNGTTGTLQGWSLILCQQ